MVVPCCALTPEVPVVTGNEVLYASVSLGEHGGITPRQEVGKVVERFEAGIFAAGPVADGVGGMLGEEAALVLVTRHILIVDLHPVVETGPLDAHCDVVWAVVPGPVGPDRCLGVVEGGGDGLSGAEVQRVPVRLFMLRAG